MSDRSRRFYDQQLDLATPREWTDLVPRAILADVAREHGGDRAPGKLTAPVHFWILVVATLSRSCSSLKDLLARFQARFGPLWGLPKECDKDRPGFLSLAFDECLLEHTKLPFLLTPGRA